MSEPRHWPACPLVPRVDREGPGIRVHLQVWVEGTVLLIHHGSDLVIPPGPCALYLGMGVESAAEQNGVFVPSGITSVQHATVHF